jgi:branched-subunit amino acid transport protein
MIIVGMMVVTYVPRLLPFYMLTGKKLPKKVKLFLEFVPYTALGALIIPGALTAVPEAPIASVLGLVFAGIFSYFKNNLIVSVVGSILIVYLMFLI